MAKGGRFGGTPAWAWMGAAGIALAGAAAPAAAQERLAQHPRAARLAEQAPAIARAYQSAIEDVRRTPVRWLDGGRAVAWRTDGGWRKFDLRTRKEEALPAEPPAEAAPTPARRRPVARGRQLAEAASPDGATLAYHRDGQLWVRPAGTPADGPAARRLLPVDPAATPPRVKYGTASWVYGEELAQSEAFGWSPDGRRLWAYRFDERRVADYWVLEDHLEAQNRALAEPYPKAGTPNPVVSLFVVDVADGAAREVPVRPVGQPEDGVGHLVYGIRWHPGDGRLRFFRADRRQRIRELCAADPATGEVQVLHREAADTWTENRPPRWGVPDAPGADPEAALDALWKFDVGGFANLVRLDERAGRAEPLTRHRFDVETVVWIDPARREVWYQARSAPNPYLLQLHRADLRTGADRRLTDPALSHAPRIAPDGGAFVAVAESREAPPRLGLFDRDGRLLHALRRADPGPFLATGARPVQRLTFPSADGEWTLYGELHFPSDYDPRRAYPLIVETYAGPESGGSPERYEAPSRWTELGFFVASFEGRGTFGRGRAFLTDVYRRLGGPEVDDQAAGARYLAARPDVRADRVGIRGVSYGGYAAAMALLRHPDVFRAALAEASVTDWRNYDTIYTERFMDLPQDNPEGYRLGAAATFAAQLRGELMLTYGTADDNVHPANTYQLVHALQRAGKRFRLMALPDQGHTALRPEAAFEFLLESLADWR